MTLKAGWYYLQVASLGDGGGGDFHLALDETELKVLPLGGPNRARSSPASLNF